MNSINSQFLTQLTFKAVHYSEKELIKFLLDHNPDRQKDIEEYLTTSYFKNRQLSLITVRK